MFDKQTFRAGADSVLDSLYRRLASASDEFEDHSGKFMVSPNRPARQLWVPMHSRSFKLDWDEVQSGFVYPESRQMLQDPIAGAVGKQLGEEVTL